MNGGTSCAGNGEEARGPIREKHANIPIFIPHMGCRHACVFCDQKTISGSVAPAPGQVGKQIESAIKTLGGRKAEIAFFGGSFTAIGREKMIAYLNETKTFLQSGAVCGVRLSTRPDCVSEDILDILEAYGVTSIELGVQSTNDTVLAACRRGHKAADFFDAARRIKARGCFTLGGQMMLGLPLSDLSKELQTANDICLSGADEARVYPTAVLAGTVLADLWRSGAYTPLSLTEGVRRGAEIKKIFEAYGVRILRMGLCAEESCEEAALAGCCHPAYGEMVESRLFGEELEKVCSSIGPEKGKTYVVAVAEGCLSRAAGYKKENRRKLFERYGCDLRFTESKALSGRQIVITEGTGQCV